MHLGFLRRIRFLLQLRVKQSRFFKAFFFCQIQRGIKFRLKALLVRGCRFACVCSQIERVNFFDALVSHHTAEQASQAENDQKPSDFFDS